MDKHLVDQVSSAVDKMVMELLEDAAKEGLAGKAVMESSRQATLRQDDLAVHAELLIEMKR